MYTYANKTQENKTRSVANRVANNNSRTTYTAQFVDNRPLAIQMRKLQERENNSRQGKQPAQLEVIKFSDLSEEQKIEAGNQFNMFNGLNGVYYNDAMEKCVNNNLSTQAYINSVLEGQKVRLNSENRKELLTFLEIQLVEPPISSGVDMTQFTGSTYSCLPGQLGNILGNKTQGLLNGQTYQGSQMYHIGGRYPEVGKPVWTITATGQVQIIGMYTHPGEDFKQYKLKEGVGPKNFTLA